MRFTAGCLTIGENCAAKAVKNWLNKMLGGPVVNLLGIGLMENTIQLVLLRAVRPSAAHRAVRKLPVCYLSRGAGPHSRVNAASTELRLVGKAASWGNKVAYHTRVEPHLIF